MTVEARKGALKVAAEHRPTLNAERRTPNVECRTLNAERSIEP
jgi:hypothetical protein